MAVDLAFQHGDTRRERDPYFALWLLPLFSPLVEVLVINGEG